MKDELDIIRHASENVIHVGIAGAEKSWIPAFAGMTESVLRWQGASQSPVTWNRLSFSELRYH